MLERDETSAACRSHIFTSETYLFGIQNTSLHCETPQRLKALRTKHTEHQRVSSSGLLTYLVSQQFLNTNWCQGWGHSREPGDPCPQAGSTSGTWARGAAFTSSSQPCYLIKEKALKQAYTTPPSCLTDRQMRWVPGQTALTSQLHSHPTLSL